MSTKSYSALLSGMWAPEGSEINQRLQKLQELERMRKEREAARQQRQPRVGTIAPTRTRLRSNPADSENNMFDNFETAISDVYGGARPKNSESSTRKPVFEDVDQVFKNFATDFTNKPLSEASRNNLAKSSRSRYEARKYERPTYTSKYTRSYSQPENQEDNIFADVVDSVLGRTENGPSYSIQPESNTMGLYETGDDQVIDDGVEQQEENGDNNEETEEIVIEEEYEYEEPLNFIQRLRNGGGMEEHDHQYGLNHKRTVNDRTLTTTMPTLPPLKRPKSDDDNVSNDNDQYEDILAVANDINAAFGSGSPKSPAFSDQNLLEQSSNTDGNFVFSASTPVSSSSTKVLRNNSSKRKQRPNSRGKSNKYESPKNEPVISSEEVIVIDESMNNNEPENADTSYTYEVIELPEESFSEEQKELEKLTSDRYASRLSEWNIMDHTTGALDEMQGFFSGQEIREDPKIWRELNGSMVRAHLESNIPDSPPKTRQQNNSDMSLEDKLSKLKSMTDEKQSKMHSKENESRRSSGKSGNSLTSSPDKGLLKLKDSENDGKTITSVQEPKKSPRDLMKDVRELKKFVHENVSEPTTPTKLESQISVEKSRTKEISTQTDNNEPIYICKHCGKSNSERKQTANKPEPKSNKLDLRVDSKNPGQNYSALEKKHLADIKKEMKESSKITADADNESKKTTVESKAKPTVESKPKPAVESKPKPATTFPSYMKSTASSTKKTAGEKTRKGSVPEINKLIENGTQRPKSPGPIAFGTQRPKSPGPIAFGRNAKGIVAQRAKTFDAGSKKPNGNQKAKPTLSLCRGSSVDREKNADAAPHSARGASHMSKSKSMEQMSMVSDKSKGLSKNQSKSKTAEDKTESIEEKTKIQKSVGEVVHKPVEVEPVSSVEAEHIEREKDLGMPPSPGTKRTRAQMTQKLLPPALSPKPVRKVESPGIITPEPASPVFFAENSPRNKPPSGGSVSQTPPKKAETTGQFTTLQDSPFIKNDAQRRNSIGSTKEGESVWVKTERGGSYSRDSSLRRSNTSAGERASLTHLSWSDSGSCDSLHGSGSSLHRSQSDRRGSTASITSRNSMLNLLDSKGTKTNVVTGAKETNVDEAYEEYISSKENSEIGDNLDDSSLIEFAQKACNVLEFEPIKRDSSTDSNENGEKTNNNDKSQKDRNGTHHMKNGFEDSTRINEDKTGKKKQKKGFLKEAPVIVPKDVQVSQSSSTSHVHTSQDFKVVAQVKGQGHQEQITQNSIIGVGEEDEEEELVQARVNLTDWDPTRLLADLYKVQMMPDTTVDISHRFIGMEGLMEKLPMNKKKATLLKTWKRRFFRAADGWLHYYETGNRDKPSDSLQLMGGKVEELGPRVLGVDDGRGKYLMVRVPTDQEFGQWKVALESQTADNVKATYVTPVLDAPPHPRKKVVIIDVGSSNIRAGILGEKPTLPQLFFPTVVAVNKQTGELTVGVDTYKPSVRKSSKILQPIRPTNKVDKGITRQFNMDMEVIPEIFKKVFADLKINPREYLVMLSTPQPLGDKLKESLMKLLIDQFHLRGVCMVPQALLALYSYNSTSGIIVDIGERMEILPIYDGLLIEGGVSRQAYGGAKVQDSLYLSLLQNKYKFNTTVEKLLVRHICEEACYVAENYKEATAKCEKDPESFKSTVYFNSYNLPEGAYTSVDLDNGCFKSPEGFFNTDLWGMDYPNIHKLIYQGIQHSPMDARKHMYRSVYLSGGVTMVPGFADRLQEELKKLAPPTVTIEVHASPQRYHAAYIGACAVASMEVFEQSCVSAEEWKKLGLKACRKWGTG